MKNKKFLLVITFIMAFAILISGCSSDKGSSSDIAPSQNQDMATEDFDDEFGGGIESTEEERGENYEPDKIITTVYIEMQTKEFDATAKKMNSLINKYKGYIENSNISHNDYVYSTGLKYADYSIRIPRENLESFVDDVVEIGNIISQNKNKRDITKQYRDTESRLKVLETKEERILALLEKAEKMEDIIVLENQLSNVIYEKENLTQNLTDMDDKVDYSTVTLNLEEVAKLTPGQNTKTPFLEKLKTAFKESFYFFTKNIGDLLIGIVYLFPYILIIAVIVYVLYKFIWKKRKDISKKPEDRK